MNECPQNESGVLSILNEVFISVFWVFGVVVLIPILLALFAIFELITSIYHAILASLPYLGWGIHSLIMLGGLYLMLAAIFYYLKERIKSHSKT